MVRIIKEGREPDTKPVVATCSRCSTVFEFFPPEAQYVSDQRDGDFYSIDCPVCKREVTKAAKSGYFGPG